MNAKRLYFALIGTIVLLSGLGIATIVVGDNILQNEAAKLVNLKLQSQVLDGQQTNLQKAKKDVAKYSSLNTVAQTIVPQDKDQALTVREIIDFAAQSGIKIGSITFPASNLGLLTPSSTTPTSSLSQVQPVKGISGVYQMPITVQSDMNSPTAFSNLISFLQLLENNRHTAEVSTLTITPNSSSGQSLSFQIVVNVYIRP